MEKHIRLLDCTLRDGGHVIDGKFGEDTIKSIFALLDVIELKLWLWNIYSFWWVA